MTGVLRSAKKTALAFLAPLFLYFILFSRIKFSGFWRAAENTKMTSILMAFLVYNCLDLLVSVLRWRHISAIFGYRIALKESLFLKISSTSLKAILPLKAGEFIRAIYLKKQNNLPLSIGMLIFSIPLIADLAVLILIAFFLYIIFIKPLSSILIFGFLALLIILYIYFVLFIRRGIFLLQTRINSNFYSKISLILEASRKIKHKDVLIILLYSLVFWAGVFISFVILLQSNNQMQISLERLLFFLSLVTLLSSIPLTAGGLGIRETAMVAMLSQFSSVENVLSAGVIFSFISFVVPLSVSMLFTHRFIGHCLEH